MKIDEINKLLESALKDIDKVDIVEDSINKQLIERLENRFQDTLDMHEDFMIEAVGGDPDTATLEQKKAVFNIMTALHDIISVQDQMEMPN